MDIVLRRMGRVYREFRTTLHGTAEQSTEVLVEVSQEGTGYISRYPLMEAGCIQLSGGVAIGRSASLEGRCTTIIEEVDSDT